MRFGTMMKSMKNKVLLFLVLIVSFIFTGCSFDKAGEYYDKGVAAFSEGKYAQASQYFKNAVELKADKAEYYISYGMSLVMEKKYDLAREQFQRAVVDKVNSIVIKNNQLAYQGLGICSLREGEYEKAVEDLKKSLEFGGDEGVEEDVRSYLCEAYIGLEEYNSAKAVIEEQLEKKESAAAYGMRGWVYFEAEKYGEAAKDFEKAISMEKNNRLEWYLALYQALLKSEDNKGAAEYLEKALKLKVKDEEDEIIMARLLIASGDFGTAKESLQKMSEKNPKAYYYLGVIAQKNSDYKEAEEFYVNYIESSAEGYELAEDIQLRLGIVREGLENDYTGQGMEKEAMESRELALSAYEKGMENKGPYEGEFYLRAIALCERSGDFEKAYDFADRYLKDNDDERIKREKKFLATRKD